jgi:hypothetical protein
MMPKRRSHTLGKAGCLLVVSFAASLTACILSPDMHAEAQQELAQELGVQAGDYGRLFPQDYYYEALSPGASIAEVHAALRGYEKVLRCPSGAEVYYYFSARDDTAVRFQVFYDDTFEHFIGLVAEDWNERGIDVQDCVAGRFGE